MTTTLTTPKVKEIKQRIWEGQSQYTVAMDFAISQSQVSRIVSGSQWYEVAWPNGAPGAFPTNRRLELERQRIEGQKRRVVAPITDVQPISYEQFGDNIINLVRHRLAREVEKDERVELEAALADAGMSREDMQEVGTSPPEYNEMKWNYLLEVARDNEIVKAAEQGQNMMHRAVICLVFENLPRDMWNSDRAYRLIREALSHLTGE